MSHYTDEQLQAITNKFRERRKGVERPDHLPLPRCAPSKPILISEYPYPPAVDPASLLPPIEERYPPLMPDVERSIKAIYGPAAVAIKACLDADGPWPMTFFGGVGTGKTCAALCIADRFRANGRQAMYFTARGLGGMLVRARFGQLRYEGGAMRTEESLLSDLRAYSLVIVDELGVRSEAKDSEVEMIQAILDGRAGRPLVLCSNFRPEDLVEVYDDRIVSRLSRGTVVLMGGLDRRRPKSPGTPVEQTETHVSRAFAGKTSGNPGK